MIKYEKPIKRKNYGSIPHLSNSKLGNNDKYVGDGKERILTIKKRDKNDTILVFEKYDGANVGIAKSNGVLVALTRGGYYASISQYKHHREFANWVKDNKNHFSTILKEGERLVGEWMLKPHGIKYNIRHKPIIFFDYFNSENKRYAYSKFNELCVPKARLLHKGDAIKVEELLPKLNERTPAYDSIEKPEGMVYRVERNGEVDFLAKWVRPDFVAGKYL